MDLRKFTPIECGQQHGWRAERKWPIIWATSIFGFAALIVSSNSELLFASEVGAESEQACLDHTCMSIRIARSPLAATFEIQVGPIWSHFGRPMLSHRHPRNLKSPKLSVTSGCRFFTYATCSVAWFASFIVMADARSMTEIRGGTSSVIRTRLTDSREEQRVVQVCHLQRRPPWIAIK